MPFTKIFQRLTTKNRTHDSVLLFLVLFICCKAGASLHGAQIDIYTNQSVLRMTPTSPFIGFNANIKAFDATMNALQMRTKAAPNACKGSCAQITSLHHLDEKIDAINTELSMMDALLTQTKPTQLDDASTLLKQINTLARRSASLRAQRKVLEQTRMQQKRQIEQDLPSMQAFFLDEPLFKIAMPVTLRFSGIYAKANYLLDRDSHELIEQIVLQNRSGIAIEKADARIFLYANRLPSAPVSFQPQIIRLLQSHPRAMKASVADTAGVQERARIPMQSAQKEQARTFHIKGLSLEASSQAKRFNVARHKVAVKQWLSYRPYQRDAVFETVMFEPDISIDAARIDVKQNGATTTSHTLLHEASSYQIYTKQRYDIIGKKSKLISKEESGWIGNSSKKDGFKLTLSNHAHEAVSIQVYERIPVSQRDDIRVRFKGIKRVLDKTQSAYTNYQLSKEGELRFTVTLKARSTQTFVVQFEIQKEHDQQIYY